MIAFKFRTVKGEQWQKYVDVRVYCGEINGTPQIVGELKLSPDEWTVLRTVLETGQDASADVLLHFEDVKK
jgi:hypothetical protein